MINPSFFPSRRLAFYMVRLFLSRSLALSRSLSFVSSLSRLMVIAALMPFS